MKLIHYLVFKNLGSRRQVLEFIKNGEVTVNDHIVNDSSFEIYPDNDTVRYKDKVFKGIGEFYYIAMNKPRGVVSTKKDPTGRATVFDILYNKHMFKTAARSKWPGLSENAIYSRYKEYKKANLNYAGRLDINTNGLLIFTNDGHLIQKIIKRDNNIKKIYRVKVFKHLDQKDIDTFRKAVYLKIDDRNIKFKCEFLHIEKLASDMVVKISIEQGENRIIKRAFEQMGHPVITLKRTQIGNIKLGPIKEGSFRFLTDNELEVLSKL